MWLIAGVGCFPRARNPMIMAFRQIYVITGDSGVPVRGFSFCFLSSSGYWAHETTPNARNRTRKVGYCVSELVLTARLGPMIYSHVVHHARRSNPTRGAQQRTARV